MTKKTLGIIGGVGPLATMYIGEQIVRQTNAEYDQDHLNMVITNNTNIPDRTAFILGESDNDPVPIIVSDARKLESAGADILIIPCNTAHSFYEKIQEQSKLPIVNMIEETVGYAKSIGAKRVGVLATTGTIKTKLYQTNCERKGMTPIVPDDAIQDVVMSLIYDDVKAGKPIDRSKWETIEKALTAAGSDTIILGCTELSIVKKALKLDKCIDSLLILARSAIEKCGYETIEKGESL